MALVADLLDVKEPQVPGGYLSGGVVADGPGVDEGGVHHHQADDRAQEDVAAKHAGGGNGDQHGQEGEGGIGDQVQEGEPVGLTESGPELRDGFHQTHHQAAGHDGGQDGNEHVAGGLEDLLPPGHLGGGGRLHVVLGSGGSAGHGEEFVVHLVDGAGADDELQLAVALKHALHAVHIFQRLLFHLAVVRDHQAEAGRAMRRADHVGAAADVVSDLLGAFSVVQSHEVVPPFLLCACRNWLEF